MTIGGALAKLRYYLNESAAGFWSDFQLYSYLDSAQMIIMKHYVNTVRFKRLAGDTYYHDPLLEKMIKLDPTNTTTVGASEQEYSLPSDFLYTDYAEYDASGSVNRKPAIYLNYNDIKARAVNTYAQFKADKPSYYIRNFKIGFFPQPSGSGANAFRHYYYKRPLVVSGTNSASNIDLDEELHEEIVLIAYSLAVIQDNRIDEIKAIKNLTDIK